MTRPPTWSHCIWSTNGCIVVLITLAKAITAASSSHAWLELASASFIGYLLADLATGIYHWAIDNYGSAKTPIFGYHIESFQTHHKTPWGITKHSMATNLHIPAQVIIFVVLPINLVFSDAIVLGFVGVFAGCALFSQQSHVWAHCATDKLPRLVVLLQDAGVILPRLRHAEHHHFPHNRGYCIVSGVWNRVLDESRFFRTVEIIVFFVLGLRPRSWIESESITRGSS